MNIIIKPCDDGFIVVNLDKVEKYGFDKAHTHIKSKKIARIIKDNVLNNRFPKADEGHYTCLVPTCMKRK